MYECSYQSSARNDTLDTDSLMGGAEIILDENGNPVEAKPTEGGAATEPNNRQQSRDEETTLDNL